MGNLEEDTNTSKSVKSQPEDKTVEICEYVIRDIQKLLENDESRGNSKDTKNNKIVRK